MITLISGKDVKLTDESLDHLHHSLRDAKAKVILEGPSKTITTQSSEVLACFAFSPSVNENNFRFIRKESDGDVEVPLESLRTALERNWEMR